MKVGGKIGGFRIRLAAPLAGRVFGRTSAITMAQAAFKRDYSHDVTAMELERLATATNRWQELLDEYTNRVNELEREDRGSAADLWVKIGRWYAEHLSHLEYAIHSVQQALRIDPSHTGALGGMGELQRKRGSWSELIETLQRLPVEQQTLLELHYWEGMGITELADVFESPEATIRTRIHRARKALREALEQSAPPEALASLETMDDWAKQLKPATK